MCPAQRNSRSKAALRKNGFIPDTNTEAADQKGGSVSPTLELCVLVLPCGKREKIWGALRLLSVSICMLVERCGVWLFVVASALIYYYLGMRMKLSEAEAGIDFFTCEPKGLQDNALRRGLSWPFGKDLCEGITVYQLEFLFIAWI